MIADWDDTDIVNADSKMAEDGIPFHARSFHIGQIICDGRLANSRTETDKVADAYRRIFPEYSRIWSGAGTGFINSLDRVKKISVPRFFGTVYLYPHDFCGFNSHEELIEFSRHREDIFGHVVSQSQMVFDIHNLVIDENRHARSAALWRKSKAYLNAITDNLQTSYYVGFSNSEIWLIFEFAAKSLLSSRGITDDEMKRIGHRKDRLQSALDDAELDSGNMANLKEVMAILPDYTETRYDPNELSRIDVITQASAAQFGAAICASAFRGQTQASRRLKD